MITFARAAKVDMTIYNPTQTIARHTYGSKQSYFSDFMLTAFEDKIIEIPQLTNNFSIDISVLRHMIYFIFYEYNYFNF